MHKHFKGQTDRVQRQNALAGARTDCREACKDRVDRKTKSECTETSKHRMQRESQSQRYKTDKDEGCISISKGQTERQIYAQRKCKDKSAKVDCFDRCKDRVQRGMQIQSIKIGKCRMHREK